MVYMISIYCSSYLVILCICELFCGVNSHGRLIDPPARGTMWRVGFATPQNYDDHALSCGGFAHQWVENDGKCGECGDPWDMERPRPNEDKGQFGTGTIARVYKEGQVVNVTIHLTANHMGWFEFRLCPRDERSKYVTQRCLNRHVLQLVDYGGTRFRVEQNKTGIFKIGVHLPKDLTCRFCVIQWHYTTGNNWGICDNGKSKPGCGPQEVFRGCSDIAIFASHDPNFYKFSNLTKMEGYDNYIKLNSYSGSDYAEDNLHSHKSISQILVGEENNGYNIKPAGGTYFNFHRTYNHRNNSRFKHDSELEDLLDRFLEPNYFSEDSENEFHSSREKFPLFKTFKDKNFSKSKIYSYKHLQNSLSTGSDDFNGDKLEFRYFNFKPTGTKYSAQPKTQFVNGPSNDSESLTADKLSNVLKLLLDFTSSSSSSKEANVFLDRMTDTLSKALVKKNRDENRKNKTYKLRERTKKIENNEVRHEKKIKKSSRKKKRKNIGTIRLSDSSEDFPGFTEDQIKVLLLINEDLGRRN